jgi:hypothetical protein
MRLYAKEVVMAEKDLQTWIDAFRAFVHSKGWSVVAEKEIAFGYATGTKHSQVLQRYASNFLCNFMPPRNGS